MPKKITQNVNKDKFFNDLPIVKPEKNAWGTTFTNYQACNLGDAVPIYYDEVLPGEKRKITMGMISHTTTPVAPIFNALYTEYRCFFVPHRLSADLLNGYSTRKSPWVKVFGEDNASADSKIVVPLTEQALPKVKGANFNYALTVYRQQLGKDDNIFDSLDYPVNDSTLLGNEYLIKNFNFINVAAYELIYQRYYRNENYESATESPLYKFLYNRYNADITSTEVNAFVSFKFDFHKANREKDYFTGAKPFTQKGDAVSVNLTGDAKLKADIDDSYEVDGGQITFEAMENPETKDIVRLNLKADLSSVSGISIEELRLLIKTQELLEKDMMYGTRYCESLNAHFGTCPLDLTLQDPQELYRTTITSNMQAIFQTSSTDGEASILGTIGANSSTQTDPFVILPETEFKEHGLIMIIATHKLQNVYDSRYFCPKFNLKFGRFAFFTPELNDLGYQNILPAEMPSFSSRGFNEAFAEYRFKFNKSHGSLSKEFPYWAPAIGAEYASISALYKEGTIILDKALSERSSVAPQFYDAYGFQEDNFKPMSLHSIPGMDGVI